MLLEISLEFLSLCITLQGVQAEWVFIKKWFYDDWQVSLEEQDLTNNSQVFNTIALVSLGVGLVNDFEIEEITKYLS